MKAMFAVVLAVTPWVSLLIALLMLLRKTQKERLSPRFFQLAVLVLAMRLALPVDLSLPAAPVRLSLPEGLQTAVIEEIQLEEISSVRPDPLPGALLPAVGETLSPPAAKPQPVPKTAPRIHLLPLLPVIWLSGAGVFLVLRLTAYSWFMRNIVKHRRPAPEELCQRARISFGHPIRVFTMPELASPMLAGLVRPAVYLPQKLPADDLNYVLVHEAGHYAHRDIPAQFLLMAAQAVHWFNPLVHWMAHAFREDMELSCDEYVLNGQSLAYRQAYGRAVLATLTSCRRQKTLLLSTGFSGSSNIKRRFQEMFQDYHKSRGLPLLTVLLAVILSASALVACGQQPARNPSSQPQTPSFAESTPQEEEAVPEKPEEAPGSQDEDSQEPEEAAGVPQDGQAVSEEQQEEEAVPEKPEEDQDSQDEDSQEPEEAAGVPQDEQAVSEEQQELPASKNLPSYNGNQLAIYEADTMAGGVEKGIWKLGELPETVQEWIWPVPDFRYVTRWSTNTHRGVDIAAPEDAQILAVADGTVTHSGWHHGYGNLVVIESPDGYSQMYAHCNALHVKNDDTVKQGDVIADVGNTGSSTGNHLHFEIRQDGYFFDPGLFLQEPKE